MCYKAIIVVVLLCFTQKNTFGQCCLKAKFENIEYINNSQDDFQKVFIEEDKEFLSKLFKNEKLCETIENISYIYISHFQTSGYNYETSSLSHSIYLFTEDMKLINWYSVQLESLSKKTGILFSVQKNEDVLDKDIEYIQSVLKQVSKNDVSNIENEQNNITSGCNCVNYESIYDIASGSTKAYFFDLYYKKLFNGDFDENFQQELEEYAKELVE